MRLIVGVNTRPERRGPSIGLWGIAIRMSDCHCIWACSLKVNFFTWQCSSSPTEWSQGATHWYGARGPLHSRAWDPTQSVVLLLWSVRTSGHLVLFSASSTPLSILRNLSAPPTSGGSYEWKCLFSAIWWFTLPDPLPELGELLPVLSQLKRAAAACGLPDNRQPQRPSPFPRNMCSGWVKKGKNPTGQTRKLVS